MKTRALSIAFGLTVIAALLAFVPVTPSRFSVSPSYAYAFTCPDQSAGTANADGTFTCSVNVGTGEQPVLQDMIYNADGTQKAVGNANVVSGGQLDTSNDPVGPVKCNGMVPFFSNAAVCIGRSISAFIGTALITVTAWLLEIAGLIFNWLMYYTVIAFGDSANGFLTTGVLNAINLTWTAFRDISNIVIIGLFTFIAISIILGLNQFGNKKLIARVLIVAVLINFSLLFTKIIIDFSNFTSYVLYSSAPNVQFDPQASGSSLPQDGVAGAFIKFLGVTSVSDTFNTLKQGADNADSGWIILLHGLFGATLLLLAAVAFIYGSFLLTVRAVVLVFLLITSSFAFATYLIPAASESKYGWSAWWKALFQNAVFAPILMGLLWATLILAKALAPAGGTLGGLLSDPTSSGNLSALFSYVIVLGFLFASFKVSSSFATSISGFSFAALGIARLAGAPLALGSRFLAAPMLRNTLGRGGAEEAKILAEQIKRETQTAATARAQNRPYDITGLTKLMKQKEVADARAKRDFNLMNTEAGKQIAKAAGLTGILAGEKKVGGFAGPRKAAAEDAAKKVEGVSLSKEQKEQIAGSIKEGMQETQAPQRAAYQQLQKAATAQLETARTTAKAAQRSERLQQKQIDAEREIEQAINEKAAIGERHRGGAIDQARHDQEMRAQDDRIKSARETIEQAKGRAQEIENLHLAEPRAKIAEARQGLASLDAEIQKAVGKIPEAEIAIKSDIANELAHHPDSYTAGLIRENISKQVKNKRLRERIKAEKEVAKEVGEDEAPATTPTT